MEICPHNKCTGCYACVNACVYGCITMQEDKMGCIHPIVNEDDCIHCNLCKRSCPNNAELIYKYPLKCFASWITDIDKRKFCASGGIGTVISEYVIRQGGVVFGSRYNESMVPVMTYTENIEDLVFFKGSRYVQSLVGNETYKHVKTFLKNNRLVLFIGTPCQIAGLKTYLQKDFDNLFTVDLICHGVCPTKYFIEEVDYLKNKYHLKEITDIRFRGNDGNNYRLSLWDRNKRKLFPRSDFYVKILHIDEAQQFYIIGFLLGVSMRENCYSCNYSRPERVADITIGDFIGLGVAVPFDYPEKNVSSVLINTEKGEALYESISKKMETLMNVERSYEERLAYKTSLLEPFKRNPLNAIFGEYYKQYGYTLGIRKTLEKEMKKRKSKHFLRILFFPCRIIKKWLK